MEWKRTIVCKKGWNLKQSNRFVVCLLMCIILFSIHTHTHILRHFLNSFFFIYLVGWIARCRYKIRKFLYWILRVERICDMWLKWGFYCALHVLLLGRCQFRSSVVVATSHDLVSIIKLTNSDAFINNEKHWQTHLFPCCSLNASYELRFFSIEN